MMAHARGVLHGEPRWTAGWFRRAPGHVRFVTIPRSNPVHAATMGGIVRDAGLSVEEFRKLL
jgi:hypothetical protein